MFASTLRDALRPPGAPSRRRALRWSLAALLAGSCGWLPATPALADNDTGWWLRLDALVARHAFPAADAELSRALATGAFRDRWGDRALYWLGYARRRENRPLEALAALQQVPPESPWFVSSLGEAAGIERDRGHDVAAIALYERALPLVSAERRDELNGPLADLYFTSGQFANAITGYRALAQGAGPQRERALFGWGWALARAGQDEAAVNVWKQGLETFPRSRYGQAVRLALGNLMLARGEHLQASTYYNEAARQTQDEALMARAELLAGEAYADTKDYGVAVAHYRAVPADSPLREPAGYGEAWCLWQAGQAAKSREVLLQWLQRWPQSTYRPAAYYALGAVEEALDRHDSAAFAWKHVGAIAPGSPFAEDALYRLDRLAYERKAYDEAIATSRALEERFPRSRYLGPALWMRGESFLAQGQYAESVKAYSQLAAQGNQTFLTGQSAEVDYKIGLAHFYAGNYAEAARVLDGITGGTVADAALFWQAEARYKLAQYDSARALYGRLVGQYPGFARVGEGYYGLGWACYRLGDFAGAKTAFASATGRLAPGRERQDASLYLALSEINLREWGAARAVLTALIAEHPEPELAARAAFQLAWTLYREGRLADASSAFGAFARDHAANALAPQALVWAGRALFREGQNDPAIRSLQAAIAHPLATAGQRYDAREQLAAAYHNAGRFDEARQVYQELMQAGNLGADRVEDLRQGIIQSRMKAGQLREARAEILKKPALADGDRETLLAIAEAFVTKGDWDQVLETYQAVPHPPDQLTFYAAKAWAEKQDFKQAIPLLEALKDTPDQELRPQALYELAAAYRAGNVLPRARTTLLALAEAYPTKPIAPVALLEAADVARAQHDTAGAQALYRRVAENKAFVVDKRRQAWMSLGDMQRASRQWGPALVAYRAARGLGPKGVLGWALGGYWAADVLVEMKQYKEALNELSSVTYPADAEPLPSLAKLKQGEALERLNRWREAVAVYTRLGASAPAAEREEARTRLAWIQKNVPKELRR